MGSRLKSRRHRIIYARATTETGGSQPHKVGRLWPHSAGAVAAGWISIYCRDFRSSLINSVVSTQFSHALALAVPRSLIQMLVAASISN